MHRFLCSSFAVVAAILLGASPSHCCAAVLTFDYTGFVHIALGRAFGVEVENFSPVAGHFTIDTAATASHIFADGRIGYRQSQLSGLRATFSSGGEQLEVEASEYLAIVGNDLTLGQDGGTKTVDSFEIVFATNFAPRLTTPLTANGAAIERGDYNQDGVRNGLDYDAWKANFGPGGGTADGNGDWIVDAADYTIWRDGGLGGYFAIEFQNATHDRFTSASLASANLAANLNLGGFNAGYCVVGDNNILPTVFFAVNGLSLESAAATSVPEAGGCGLILASLVSWLCLRPRNQRT